jgi:tetratricopeptide (TPR) repeat protein
LLNCLYKLLNNSNMKYALTLLSCLLTVNYCLAQHATHTPSPKAKALNDSAASRYAKCNGDPDKIKDVIPMLDAAIKVDSYYFEAWNNKVALQGQLDQYENAYKTLRTMEHLFPKKEEVQFELAILEYVTKRTKEANATWGKLLDHYNALLVKNPNNGNTKGLLYNKGITLILLDKANEGKAILNKLYNDEKDYYVKSSIAFYINSTKEQIIADKIPGK